MVPGYVVHDALYVHMIQNHRFGLCCWMGKGTSEMPVAAGVISLFFFVYDFQDDFENKQSCKPYY